MNTVEVNARAAGAALKLIGGEQLQTDMNALYDALVRAEQCGYEDGFMDGYDDGYEDGFMEDEVLDDEFDMRCNGYDDCECAACRADFIEAGLAPVKVLKEDK